MPRGADEDTTVTPVMEAVLSDMGLDRGPRSLLPDDEPDEDDVEIDLDVLQASVPPSMMQMQRSLNPAGAQGVPREEWGSRMEFLLSLVGYAVGVGNIWRFPYLAYTNGGGTFIIPYLVCLVCLGMPLFLLELAVGQLFRKSSYHAFAAMHPRLRGVGMACTVITTIVSIYYNVILAWSIYFLFSSFNDPLPWTDAVAQAAAAAEQQSEHGLPGNLTAAKQMAHERLHNTSANPHHLTSTAAQYWHEEVLHRSTGFSDLNFVVWPLFGCLAFAWFFVFCALLKGIKATGKIVYVTALTPFFLMAILVLRGLTLSGATLGLKYYLVPDMDELLKPHVWAVAANQIFYSIGPCFGVLTTYASFNKRTEDIIQDTIVVCCTNAGFSLFSGIAVFSVLGHMSLLSGVPVPEVATSGEGLAFVVFPLGLSMLGSYPMPQIFSALFFVMLFMLGIDSQFANVEVPLTFLTDIGVVRKYGKPRVLGGICASLCLAGALVVSDAGIFWFEIIDTYIGWIGLFVVAIVECVAVGWIHGGTRLADEVEAAIGRRIPSFVIFSWRWVTPLVSTLLIVSQVKTEIDRPMRLEPGYLVARIIAMMLGLLPAAIVFIAAVLPMDAETEAALRQAAIEMETLTPDWTAESARYRNTAYDGDIGAGSNSASRRRRHGRRDSKAGLLQSSGRRRVHAARTARKQKKAGRAADDNTFDVEETKFEI